MASLVKERYGTERNGESGEERVWNGTGWQVWRRKGMEWNRMASLVKKGYGTEQDGESGEGKVWNATGWRVW